MAELYRVCGHCEKLVSEKTFKEHRRLFFHDHTWIKDNIEDQEHESSSSSSLCALSDSHDVSSLDMNSSCCDISSEVNGASAEVGQFFIDEDSTDGGKYLVVGHWPLVLFVFVNRRN